MLRIWSGKSIRARTWSTVKFTIFDSEKGP
jgi:hypothetical protein